MPFLPVPKRAREEFEPRGVEPFANLDDIISIGMTEITLDTVCGGCAFPPVRAGQLRHRYERVKNGHLSTLQGAHTHA